MAVQDRAGGMTVPHDARGVRLARRRLVLELTGLVPPMVLTDAVVVVAELLGNSVRHADPLPGGVIRLAWRVGAAAVADEACVHLSVTDGGSAQAPALRVVGPDSVNGRGLAIVAALAVRWGVEREPHAQRVWAELGVPVRRR